MSTAETYGDLVKEAFIDPIRSVMIIDDQYPTWEEILDDERWTKDEAGNLATPKTSKLWWADTKGPRKVLRQFRERDKGLMIDIHDCQPPDTIVPDQIATFLHQSDLLVLDYQLEGEAAGGDRAQEIAHHLLTKNHFNLIVVHTNKDDLLDPFSEILLRFLGKSASIDECEKQIEAGESAIEEAEDESLADNLRAAFLPLVYLAVRHPTKGKARALSKLIRGEAPFDGIKTLLVDAGLGVPKFRNILTWMVSDFETRNKAFFSDNDAQGLNWSERQDCLWIRTDRGFISFAKKNQTDDLLACIQEALEDWQPTPSRLLSAKFRHSIDEYGVVAEDKTLSKRHVYAKFYNDIKSANEQKRGALLDDHVTRQTEQITAEIQQAVRDFGLTVERIDRTSENQLELSKHYGVDLENAGEANIAVRHYNHYVSCIPVHGYHLTCGHIFELEGKKWVVVSPACDMVPGQRQMGFENIHEDHRPFVALQLYENGHNLTDTEINSGNFVFLEKDGDVEVYCSFQKSSDPVEQAPKVTWSNFVALNQGVLSEDNSFGILTLDAKQEAIESKKHKVRVSSQLRYEFALNLINRLGLTMTRIGLSYTGHGSS